MSSTFELGRVDDLAFPDSSAGRSIILQDPLRAAGHGRAIHLGQPASQFQLDRLQVGLSGQVMPFVRIGLQVIQLFGVVGITDVPPALRADRMIPLIMGCDRRTLADELCVFEQRDQRLSFQV